MGKSGFVQLAAAFFSVVACQALHAQTGNCRNPVGFEALEACSASLESGQLVELGKIYFRGEAPLLRPDKLRAIALYKRAAERDHEGKLILADALEETGAPPEEWLKWVEGPALYGDDRALSRLQSFSDNKLKNDQRLREQYLKTLTKVLDHGKLSDSWYWTLAGLMGTLYEHGLAGVSQDSQEAVRWYLRAADRGGFKALGSAMAIYKLGAGLPQDHNRAEQLLDRSRREQSSFYTEHPEFYIEALYGAADLGFSSAARRLADIHAKGLFGVKADAAAAARWKRYAQAARYAEKNGAPEPAARTKVKPNAVDAQCESEAKAFIEQKRPNQLAVTHLAHFNKTLGLCLADVTLRAELPAQRTSEPMRVMVNVRDGRELGSYMSSGLKQVPLDCRTQTIRLRASFEMEQSGCRSLAEYEAFVDKFMNECNGGTVKSRSPES